MEIFFQLETYIALLTLTIIEIILGIDNIIFISIVTNKVKKESRNKARITGLLLALVPVSYTHLTLPTNREV